MVTAASKSAFSSGPNRSSNDALALRLRVVFLEVAAVLRVLRAGPADGAGLREVLRVLRTGASAGVEDVAVRRVLRTGLVSCTGLALGPALGRIPGFESSNDREGPLGRDGPGGPAEPGLATCLAGGPRLLAGGPWLPPAGGPRLGVGEVERDGGPRDAWLSLNDLVGDVLAPEPNGFQSSSSSSSS